MNTFFKYLLSKIKPSPKHNEGDKALIARMLRQANAIANGERLIDDKLPPPVIPERRKVKR